MHLYKHANEERQLIKIGQDLFRVLELQHVTPGNLRGFVRVKFRNIRTGALADQKLRSEDSVDRATLDEREMQYLYRDGEAFHFMDTGTYEQLHIDAEALGDNVNYLVRRFYKVEFYGSEPVGISCPADRRSGRRGHRPGIKVSTASNHIKARRASRPAWS